MSSARKSVILLGLNLAKAAISLADVELIENFPTPQAVIEVGRFCGSQNFIKNLSLAKLFAPFTELIKEYQRFDL